MIPTNLSQQPAQETIYYQDQTPIFISSLRVVLGNQIFATKNITSVRMLPLNPNYLSDIALFMVGLILALVGFADLIRNVGAPFPVFLSGLLMAGLAVFLFKSRRPRYVLEINNGSNPVRAIYSLNPQYINALVAAVTSAIMGQPR